jgi:hypothetical protein
MVAVLAAEWRFGARIAGDAVLLSAEFGAPLLV